MYALDFVKINPSEGKVSFDKLLCIAWYPFSIEPNPTVLNVRNR